ncbi:protein dispatched [Hetaerina americana]|uniref:protein dispatched n=1 Tax=Hetaerina americana TaxID=62018 RepID=UPI003A7F1F06
MKWLNSADGSSLLMRYSRLLASHPYAVLLSVASIFITLISLPFITHNFPDFSDPQLGFEPRQTEISKRLTAWDNLVEATRASGPLTFNPSELHHTQDNFYKVHFSDGRKKTAKPKVLGRKREKIPNDHPLKSDYNLEFTSKKKSSPPSVDNEHYVEEEDDESDVIASSLPQGNSSYHDDLEDFFCGEPSSDYARIVLSAVNGESLLTYDSIIAMCHLEHEILIGSNGTSDVHEVYKSLCQPSKSGACCTPWSIPNYVVQLANHTSCLDLSESDVKYAVRMLNQCGAFYFSHQLSTECKKDDVLIDCHPVPKECLHNSWAHNIFHFLADKELSILGNKESPDNIPFLKYAVVFLPLASSTASMAYYSAVKATIPLSYHGIQVEAMELGLRDSLFDHHLIQDSWMLIGVAVAIGSCVWMYSGSLFIAVASILSIPLSLGLSYCAYKYIFRLSFFPFLNLVAAVISLGIGVDDAFIFCKMWKFLKWRSSLMKVQRLNGALNSSNVELQNYPQCISSSANQSKDSEEGDTVQSSQGNHSTQIKSVRPERCNPENLKDFSSSQYSVDHGDECVMESILDNSDEDGQKIKSRIYKDTCVDADGVSGSQLSGSESIEWLVCETLKRAFQSMFVTSLTTAAAFYFSYLSKVTAIRCFSIFAGTAVITNFVLMLTWFPAAVIIAERIRKHNCVERCNRPCVVCPENIILVYSRAFSDKLLGIMKKCDKRFDIPKQWAWVCVITLGIVALLSVVIASYYPGLHPPNELQFQLLHSSHLFERYHLIFRPLFNFEENSSGQSEEPGMPLRFVFGVLPEDIGNPLDPTSRVPRGLQATNLHFDDEFDMASYEAQIWFLKFCQSVRSQPFYGSNSGPLLNNCFMETFKKWMSRRCIEPIEMLDRTPCCETSKFPFARKVFKKCLLRALAQLHKTPHLLDLHRGESAGPRFLKTKPHKMVAAVVEYESGIPFTTSFTAMNQFYNTVETWMNEQLNSAPHGLKCGWFVSNLHFYDLQLTLSTGVLSGVCISLGVSTVTLLIFTCNILKSLLTSLSIASATSVALASLSLLGWSLGPVESLTLSLAVGLSADFALHYAICHQRDSRKDNICLMMCKSTRCQLRLCEHFRENNTCSSCEPVDVVAKNKVAGYEVDHSKGDVETIMEPFVGVPATLAAITTVIAGLLMLPSSVVAYYQVGIFLIVLISTSWLYSTFFLLSLLRLFQAY